MLVGCDALWCVQDAMQFVGRVAYHDFGGVADEEEEMDLVSKVAKDGDVIVLRNHGILVLGEDIERAFSRLYYYERACQCQLLVMVSLCCAAVFHRWQPAPCYCRCPAM